MQGGGTHTRDRTPKRSIKNCKIEPKFTCIHDPSFQTNTTAYKILSITITTAKTRKGDELDPAIAT